MISFDWLIAVTCAMHVLDTNVITNDAVNVKSIV